MWVFTQHGFFSAVQHIDKPDTLIIRARVKNDLTALRKHYFPTLSKTKFLQTADYPYRAMISKDDFAKGMERITHDLTYPNFKNAVAQQQGRERYSIYTKIWGILWELEEDRQRFATYMYGIPRIGTDNSE